jgi:hypothetical protein
MRFFVTYQALSLPEITNNFSGWQKKHLVLKDHLMEHLDKLEWSLSDEKKQEIWDNLATLLNNSAINYEYLVQLMQELKIGSEDSQEEVEIKFTWKIIHLTETCTEINKKEEKALGEIFDCKEDYIVPIAKFFWINVETIKNFEPLVQFIKGQALPDAKGGFLSKENSLIIARALMSTGIRYQDLVQLRHCKKADLDQLFEGKEHRLRKQIPFTFKFLYFFVRSFLSHSRTDEI